MPLMWAELSCFMLSKELYHTYGFFYSLPIYRDEDRGPWQRLPSTWGQTSVDRYLVSTFRQLQSAFVFSVRVLPLHPSLHHMIIWDLWQWFITWDSLRTWLASPRGTLQAAVRGFYRRFFVPFAILSSQTPAFSQSKWTEGSVVMREGA